MIWLSTKISAYRSKFIVIILHSTILILAGRFRSVLLESKILVHVFRVPSDLHVLANKGVMLSCGKVICILNIFNYLGYIYNYVICITKMTQLSTSVIFQMCTKLKEQFHQAFCIICIKKEGATVHPRQSTTFSKCILLCAQLTTPSNLNCRRNLKTY